MTALVDLLTPAWDQLLVRRDPLIDQVGSGLVIPERAQGSLLTMHAGTVLKAGPDAPRYPPGTRIAFGRHAMVGPLGWTAKVGGEEPAEIGLVLSTEVMCTFDASPDVLPRPLDLDGFHYARAPVGLLLVERSTVPLTRGSIIIPDGSTSAVRPLEATVRSRHPSTVCPFDIDDRVLLSPAAGRAIPFGLLGPRVLWNVTPGQVLCRVRSDVDGAQREEMADRRPETPLAYRRAPVLSDDTPVYDEGDARAPR